MPTFSSSHFIFFFFFYLSTKYVSTFLQPLYYFALLRPGFRSYLLGGSLFCYFERIIFFYLTRTEEVTYDKDVGNLCRNVLHVILW